MPRIKKIEDTITKDEQITQLQKQLAWYKSFFDNATDAVFIVQPETWSVLDANEFAAILLNIPRNKLLGTTLPQFRRIFKLLQRSSSPIVLSELTLETADNFSLMVEVSARFVEYEGQNLIQAIARDVGEQHALTDKLVQADKLVLLGQLSAGVAHEIRNPLAAVNLNLQILQRKIPEDAPESNFIKTALQGVDRIARIVEVTLNFSRPAVPDIKGLSLNSLITTTLELVSSVLKRKEITVELKLFDKLPLVAADGKQMQQVFINLLTNAADAIKSKGNISVSTFVEQASKQNERNTIVCSIADTGSGIPPEDLPKIFNPFFTRKPEGTGLGLPITQRILHQHGGIIDVESKVGEGTTFYIKLPEAKM
ncbi:MAG TPA: ATP-binding protein [Candidatus Kapabacteria bacterium]|nr:ATP-binding protein [Candidatus Kapabacteria bacterium]HPO63208.1 ATP-binding protein [Candidatus Kapabacteria bacterium]